MAALPRIGVFDKIVNVNWGDGVYALFEWFASDILGSGHNHNVSVRGAEVVYSRSQNIETGGIRFYEGIFLVKIPTLPVTLTASLTGAQTYTVPSAPTFFVCAALFSEGWVGPGWGDTDGNWQPYTAAQWNSQYVDAYIAANPDAADSRQLLYTKQPDVLWGNTVAGSYNPFGPNPWQLVLDSAGHSIPCSEPPPSGTVPTVFPLPFDLFFSLFPIKDHVVYPKDKFIPIRKSVQGRISDAVFLWDAAGDNSTIGDGTFQFRVQKNAYRIGQPDRLLRMFYPTTALRSAQGASGVVPYGVSDFTEKDGAPIQFAPGSWNNLPVGPPPLF